MVKKRLKLSFKSDIVSKPITYNLIKHYDTVINILQARIFPDEEGQLILDIKSESEDNIKRSIKYLQDEGVVVNVVEKTIVFDDDKCINCGACTGVCKAGALTLDKKTWELKVNQEKCVLCEMCLSACSVNAISLKIG
ncbi:MAG: NIL domain-containing protein [Halothermotrichaceae bacterium]